MDEELNLDEPAPSPPDELDKRVFAIKTELPEVRGRLPPIPITLAVVICTRTARLSTRAVGGWSETVTGGGGHLLITWTRVEMTNSNSAFHPFQLWPSNRCGRGALIPT